MLRLIIIITIAFLAAANFAPKPALTVVSANSDSERTAIRFVHGIPAATPAITDVDVLIDAGHGGIDGGTVFGSILEKDINLAIAKKTYAQLQAMGLTAVLDRTDDYALSSDNTWLKSSSRHRKDLAQRSHLANELKPKALISLHVNAAKRAGKSGPIVLHQKTAESKELANRLQQSLNQLYGVEETPRHGKTYYLLKHAKVPAVIVEMGFLTNESDRRRLTDPAGQEEIARCIAEGIKAYLEQCAAK